ncbi:MAG: glycoside hydrolase [Gammaproteobacteria bacterium]|nr:glycoside hydrolase [Gammaproteobacteria bacterium]
MRLALSLYTVILMFGCATDTPEETTSVEQRELIERFKQPPVEYGPHAWWHWMNGAIDQSQAVADLEWMSAQGIAGVQLFDAGMGPAPEHPLTFGSAPWREAVKQSASAAQSLGMDFVITTSPGWSATGGPWVAPEQAMKKWVWSDTRVEGGQVVDVSLPHPPTVAGPYQDIPLAAMGHGSHPASEYYQDVKVLAYPVSAAPALPLKVVSEPAISALLSDGQFWPASSMTGDAEGVVTLVFDAGDEGISYGITLGLPGARGFGSPNPPIAHWYRCDTEHATQCVELAELPATRSLTRTAAYAPVAARYYKLVLTRDTKPGFIDTLGYTDGASRLPFPAHASAYVLSEVTVHNRPVVHSAEEKAGFAAAPRYYSLATPAQAETAITPENVLDLSAKMTADGKLHWQAPAGTWQVVRLGYNLTGHENGPAQQNATGLEVDKLDPERVRQYLDTYFAHYQDAQGDFFPGITGILSDSIESGPQNATPSMLTTLQEQLNYDPIPYLPALQGKVISSASDTDKFLYDVRRYVADTLTSAHYGTIARYASEHGLTYYTEALEDHRPQLGNDLDIRLAGGIPMAAFWYVEPGRSPKPTYIADIKGAASVATVKGSTIVAVEAMTTFGHPWAVGPAELRRAADLAFVYGGNRLMLHSSVHQNDGVNYTPGKPMMTLLGHYFNRNNTWASMAKPWITYLTRTQYLLQQGYPRASFGYFIGDEAPVTSLFGEVQPQVPQGYDYDYLSAAGLALLTVTPEGNLRTRQGTEYAFLYLGGDSDWLTINTLKAIERLAKAGATIVGQAPKGSPSLNDSPEEVTTLIKRIWRMSNTLELQSVNEAIDKLNLPVQYQITSAKPDSVLVENRTLERGELLFVVNTHSQAQQISVAIPDDIKGETSTVWQLNAVTGEQRVLAQVNGQISIPIGARDSTFLLFESNGRGVSYDSPTATIPHWQQVLTGPWQLSGDQHYGKVAALTLEALTPFSELDDIAWQGYSGIAHYQSDFTVSQQCAGDVYLQADRVGDMAEVLVNGEQAGYVWTPPYRINITGLIQPGRNQLQINVANYWANRLIAQANHQQSQAGFAPNVYRQGTAPRVAGLAGNIYLECQ